MVDEDTYDYFSSRFADYLNYIYDTDYRQICTPEARFTGNGNCPSSFHNRQIEKITIWNGLNRTAMGVLKKIADFIYGTERVKRKYLKDHSDETIFAADASKGIMTKSNKDIERGLDWITSQRAVVLLSNQQIKCGQWDIPLDHIATAEMVKINTAFGPAQVLKITTIDQNHFQFGMQMNPEWTTQTALPLTFTQGKVKYSLLSIIARVVLIAFLIYWVIERFL